MCGWTLARGHARSGQRVAIAAYLGVSGRFDQSVAEFAVSYADQAEKDYDSMLKAIKRGKIPVESGIYEQTGDGARRRRASRRSPTADGDAKAAPGGGAKAAPGGGAKAAPDGGAPSERRATVGRQGHRGVLRRGAYGGPGRGDHHDADGGDIEGAQRLTDEQKAGEGGDGRLQAEQHAVGRGPHQAQGDELEK